MHFDRYLTVISDRLGIKGLLFSLDINTGADASSCGLGNKKVRFGMESNLTASWLIMELTNI